METIKIEIDGMHIRQEPEYKEHIMYSLQQSFIENIIKDFNLGLNEGLLFLDEGTSKTIMKIPIDEKGYPIGNSLKTMNINRIPKFETISNTDIQKDTQVIIRDIFIKKPLALIFDRLRMSEEYVLIWEGELFGEEWQNIESLDVLSMQKIVSEAIEKQDCIILDNTKDLIGDIKDLQ